MIDDSFCMIVLKRKNTLFYFTLRIGLLLEIFQFNQETISKSLFADCSKVPKSIRIKIHKLLYFCNTILKDRC